MRLHQERDIARRGRILDFPHQLGRLGEPLSLFIELAFAGNRYQRAAQLRGFYLTSAPSMQSGMDPITSSIGRHLGSDSPALPATRQGRARFIHNLLSRVIFPEAELAGLDQREIKRISWRQRILFASAAACLLVAGITWAYSFSANNARLEQLRSLAQQLQQDQNRLQNNKQTAAMLKVLDDSYAASQVYADRKQVRWRERAGLYQGDAVNPALNQDYREHLEQLLLKNVALRLETRIETNMHDREQLFNNLRAYLMLGMHSRRDKAWLQEWMAADWSQRYAGNTPVQASLNAHFARLLEQPFRSYTLDPHLISSARHELRRESLANVLYRTLVEKSSRLPEYRLINHLGPRGALLTSNQNSLPGFYTQTGYQQVFLAQGNNLVQDMLQDNWVLGGSDDLSSQDRQRLMQEMEQLYFEDYANYWSELLARISLEPISDSNQATQRMSALAAANSPFIQLLEEVRNNTQLSSGVAAPNRAIRSMERRFEALHQLLDEEANPGAEMLHALQAMDTLHTQLGELAQASAPGQTAFNMAKERIAGQADAITQLRSAATRLPQPVSQWLTDLSGDSWVMVLDEAYKYLNQRYSSELLANWRSSIGQRYPFRQNTESEVALGDFREFFRSQGTADRFFARYLRPFISSSARGYQVRQVDGHGLPVSRELLAQMNRAERIRRSFFAENPNEPQVQFSLEPVFLDSNLGRASLRIGQQNLEYRHGPIVQTAFRWPVDNEAGRASLVLEDLGGKRLTLDQNRGVWSLFHLLDELKVEHHSDRDVLLLKANLSGMRAHYLLHSQRSPNPFDLSLLRNFSLPTRL